MLAVHQWLTWHEQEHFVPAYSVQCVRMKLMYTNHTTLKLHKTRIQNMQFALYICDTPVALKQSQGHQTYNDKADPNQGYD